MVRRHKEWGRKWLPTTAKVAIAVAALVGVIQMQRTQLARPSMWVTNPKVAEEQEATRLRFLQKLPTFGFNNLLADWVFLNFLQYDGDMDVRRQTGYGLSPAYFDIITRLDPRFLGIYLFLSGSVSYQAGQPEAAIQLMKRGTEALSPKINPLSFQIWRLMGIDQLILLGDIPGSIHSHEMAAQWVQGTPYQKLTPVFQQAADFLRTDPNSVLVRLQAWTDVYAQALAFKDQDTQARAKREIAALGGELVEKEGRIGFVLKEPIQQKTLPTKPTAPQPKSGDPE